MSILDKIVARKKEELESNKKRLPASRLERSSLFRRQPLSFRKALTAKGASGIIAEFKRKSPSKGLLNGTADVTGTTSGYEAAGASALSVLTDIDFFGGSKENLEKARASVNIPILRKDFIIDEYQVMEARAMGADVILLIAAILTVHETERLARFAQSLGLEVLLEVHDEQELGHINSFINVVGINNRNLNDFTTDVQTSFRLGEKIPSSLVKISESAISDPAVILTLKEAGFRGFLIGETFMKETDPAAACLDFIRRLNVL
ncbi:MAG TPA: indole-3-glycerol phosphate synthase TrpC [Anseongella sp.]